MSPVYDAIVIGGGANGLVNASLLAGGGLRVLLLEQSSSLAGQARSFEFASGYYAPPLGLDAGWLPPALAREFGAGAPALTLQESPLTVAAAPGRFLELSRDTARATAALHPFSPADAVAWPGFVTRMQRLAAFLAAIYQQPAPDIETTSARELWPLLGLARKLRGLGRTDMMEFLRIMPMSVQDLVEDVFESEPLRAAIAACGVHDQRQGPRSGGTTFVLLHHMVGAPAGALRGRGVWSRGPAAFAMAAEHLARQRGVTVRTNTRVERILVKDYAVTGVVLAGGEEIRARRVISSADPARTLLGMVDPVWFDPELLLALRNIRYRGCTSFVLYALDGWPEWPGLEDGARALRGIVSLSSSVHSLERAADAAKYGTVPAEPHIELTAPSLAWADQAPPAKHVLVARVHYTPWRLREGSCWDEKRARALEAIVTSRIEQCLPGFTSRVLHAVPWTPAHLEAKFGLTEGAASHGELALDQILFMRPVSGLSRYATPVDGLYLCGAGTHPGPATAGGSGWLAARTILEEKSRDSH
jgi:phytoene dehydrogenase-like protein